MREPIPDSAVVRGSAVGAPGHQDRCLAFGSDGLPKVYRIAQVRVENGTVRSFVLDGAMEATPGQFVMVWLPGVDEKPFSLSCADPITITVARVGPFTAALHALSVGERVWLRGPLGNGFALCAGPLLLVAGGYGAAPLLYLAQVARRDGRTVWVSLGARTADALFFQERFAGLGCAVHVATDDGSVGRQGTAVALAADLLAGGMEVGALYACGPRPMLEAVRRLAGEYRRPCQLSYEAYMRCGIGVCGSCAVDGRLVCHDGPVFVYGSV